jgi:hypothetical protein
MKTDHCEYPNHEDDMEAFLEKFPSCKKRCTLHNLTVDSEEWAIPLENPDKNTIKCCQVCSITEGMRRASRSTVVVQNITALKWLSPSYTIIYNYPYPPVI